jgi:hypothetical protein
MLGVLKNDFSTRGYFSVVKIQPFSLASLKFLSNGLIRDNAQKIAAYGDIWKTALDVGEMMKLSGFGCE